jgi:hypothetical protein
MPSEHDEEMSMNRDLVTVRLQACGSDMLRDVPWFQESSRRREGGRGEYDQEVWKEPSQNTAKSVRRERR